MRYVILRSLSYIGSCKLILLNSAVFCNAFLKYNSVLVFQSFIGPPCKLYFVPSYYFPPVTEKYCEDRKVSWGHFGQAGLSGCQGSVPILVSVEYLPLIGVLRGG